MRTIKVGTRQSALALTQTGQVVDRLKQLAEASGIECRFEIVKIVTKGDRILDVTLSKVGGKGLFVKEIEQALLSGEIDMAVHSMKDVPSVRQNGLVLGAVPKRADARDCLIARKASSLEELPQGARVGTSSLRRQAQLLAHRPDLRVEPVRGNIDSRLRKLESEGFDAILLAAAGLIRMGWTDRISGYLPPDVSIPAVGQGALGIECRVDDGFMRELLALLQHEPTALAVRAERSFLGRLNGGCQVPIGAYAVLADEGEGSTTGGDMSDQAPNGLPPLSVDTAPLIRLTGVIGRPDGSELFTETASGTDPERLGREVAETLLIRGGDRILADYQKEVSGFEEDP
ncbi:hydroxymethylbilane synthase [Gorillibacterium timonense]|uniref:hydroxymethylbilane synthase n=1 Tax=Gorillibacterium timonense TaxID=1689269 RepID=UPI00071CF35A|nr:hydroxymethylbilane synthase [Gorillibacterium timonense]